VACKAKVQLSWISADGTPCGTLCNCKDISQEGMQLVAMAAIPPRTSVQFLIPNSPLQGSGTVRSCAGSGSKYMIGLTFATQLRIDPATTPIPGIEIIEVFGAPSGDGAGLNK